MVPQLKVFGNAVQKSLPEFKQRFDKYLLFFYANTKTIFGTE